jgi:hypothetical protein
MITADIRYVEAAKNYAKIYTPSQLFITLTTLLGLEQALPPGELIQIHLSFLVVLDHECGKGSPLVEVGAGYCKREFPGQPKSKR